MVFKLFGEEELTWAKINWPLVDLAQHLINKALANSIEQPRKKNSFLPYGPKSAAEDEKLLQKQKQQLFVL